MGWFTKKTPEEIAKKEKLAAETAAKFNAWCAQFETPEGIREWEKARLIKKVTKKLDNKSYVVLESAFMNDLEETVGIAMHLGYKPIGAVQVDFFFNCCRQSMAKIG